MLRCLKRSLRRLLFAIMAALPVITRRVVFVRLRSRVKCSASLHHLPVLARVRWVRRVLRVWVMARRRLRRLIRLFRAVRRLVLPGRLRPPILAVRRTTTRPTTIPARLRAVVRLLLVLLLAVRVPSRIRPGAVIRVRLARRLERIRRASVRTVLCLPLPAVPARPRIRAVTRLRSAMAML